MGNNVSVYNSADKKIKNNEQDIKLDKTECLSYKRILGYITICITNDLIGS